MNDARRSRDERGAGLKYEHRGGVAPGVERQGASERQCRGGPVDPWCQGLPPQVGHDRRRRTLTGGLVIGHLEIGLCLLGHGVATVVYSVQNESLKPGDARRWKGADITVHGCRSGVRDARAGRHRKTSDHAQPVGPQWRRLRRCGPVSERATSTPRPPKWPRPRPTTISGRVVVTHAQAHSTQAGTPNRPDPHFVFGIRFFS